MALSREQMIAVIRGGGSVSYKGRLIVTEEKIPGIAEFEMTDEQRETEREKLRMQLAALDKKSPEPAESASDDFPENFPARAKAVFEKLGKTYAEVSEMDREALMNVNGIAATSAYEILAFVEAQNKK